MGTITAELLRERMRGEVITAGDPGYDEARKVYNAMIDRRPAVVVRPANAGDVAAAVNFARENQFELAVRGGGHSAPGYGTVDDGLVIDLSRMRDVRVDPGNAGAMVEGGATWGDVNTATHAFGMATTGGIISTTGVGGLTLGGGIGYLARGLGLSIDNVVSAEVVTADGRLVVATEDENGDLFWAIRGGGGNFGVVTSFEFRLHPVEHVYGGPMLFELESGRDVFRFYREFIATAPEQFGGFPAFQIAPPLPFIPEDRYREPFVAFVSCWAGPIDEGERVLKPMRDVAPVFAEHVGPMPYPAINSAFDALMPAGLQHYWKGNFVTELTDEAIEAHLEHGPKCRWSIPRCICMRSTAPSGAWRLTRQRSRIAERTSLRSLPGRGQTPRRTKPTSRGSVTTTTRPLHCRRTAGTSTSCRKTTRTGSRPTTGPTMSGSPRSRGDTTPTTSSM